LHCWAGRRGLGQWRIVAVAVAIAFILLTVGRRLERWLHQVLGDKDEPDQKPAAPVSSPDTPAP
jgi:putative Mg2+ transporter-C (MgtC) family protein